MGDIDISLTFHELGIIICALRCQANYYRNALGAFRGTAHEEFYKKNLAEIDEQSQKFMHIYNLNIKE